MTPRNIGVLDITEVNCDAAHGPVVTKLIASFHERARAVLLEQSAIQGTELSETVTNLEEFFRTRFKTLNLCAGDQVKFTLNPWNEGDEQGRNKLGLQSIQVDVIGSDLKSKLLKDETEAPTIGVITPHLLEDEPGAEMAIAAFDVKYGEEIHVMSPVGFAIDQVQPEEEKQGYPKKLCVNDQPLVVIAPDKVRTILAKTNARPAFLCRPAQPPSGVYACRYIKKPAHLSRTQNT